MQILFFLRELSVDHIPDLLALLSLSVLKLIQRIRLPLHHLPVVVYVLRVVVRCARAVSFHVGELPLNRVVSKPCQNILQNLARTIVNVYNVRNEIVKSRVMSDTSFTLESWKRLSQIIADNELEMMVKLTC